MAQPLTKEEAFAKLGEMLRDAHVLEPKTGLAATKANLIGGSKYDVHLENVTPKLADEINAEFKRLAGSSSSFNGLHDLKKHLNLENITVGLVAEDIRNVAAKVGLEISGDGKFQQALKAVDAKVADALNKPETSMAKVQEDIKKGGGVNTNAAAIREEQGLAPNTPLVKTRSEQMAEQEAPSSGLPARLNGGTQQGKGGGRG